MTGPEVLWAVHVQGPDDVIAARDRYEADARTAEINASWEAFKLRPGFDPDTCGRWHAVVVPYPGTAEQHAREVARGDERWEG